MTFRKLFSSEAEGPTGDRAAEGPIGGARGQREAEERPRAEGRPIFHTKSHSFILIHANTTLNALLI